MANVPIVCGAGIVPGKEIMALELITGSRERDYIVDVITNSWGSGELLQRCEKFGVRNEPDRGPRARSRHATGVSSVPPLGSRRPESSRGNS